MASKDKINWSYLLFGLFFCVGFFWKSNGVVSENELETKAISVKKDISYIGGRKSEYAYRTWSNEYPCSFVIKKPGGLAANWKNLDDIKKGDTLIIQVHTSRLPDLNNKSEDIPIYSLIKNGKPIYNLDGYNNSKKTLERRWNIVLMIMSVLFILRGLTIISSKAGYILAGISALTIIILRFANIWW